MATSKPPSLLEACRAVPSWIVPVLLLLMGGLVFWGGMKERVSAAPTTAYIEERYETKAVHKADVATLRSEMAETRKELVEGQNRLGDKLDAQKDLIIQHMERDAPR